MRSEAFLLHHDHTGTEHLLIIAIVSNGPLISRSGSSPHPLLREFDGEGPVALAQHRASISTVDYEDRNQGSRTRRRRLNQIMCSRFESAKILRSCESNAYARALSRRRNWQRSCRPEHLPARSESGDGVSVQTLLDAEPASWTRAVYEKIAETRSC